MPIGSGYTSAGGGRYISPGGENVSRRQAENAFFRDSGSFSNLSQFQNRHSNTTYQGLVKAAERSGATINTKDARSNFNERAGKAINKDYSGASQKQFYQDWLDEMGVDDESDWWEGYNA